jgi:hypothetical protein
MFRFADNSFLAHRLAWVWEKIAWARLLHLLLPAGAFQTPFLSTWLMVLDAPLFTAGAFAVLAWHLMRRGHSWPIAILAPAAVMIASSGNGLFTGGLSECLMCLLVAAMTAAASRDKAGAPAAIIFIACGALLVFFKLYAAPFVLLMVVVFPVSRRLRLGTTAALCAAPLVWLLIQSLIVGRAHGGGMISFYLNLMNVFQPGTMLLEAFHFLFSFSYGVLPCFPLLLFAAFAPATRCRVLLYKIAGLLGVMVMLLPFSFWFGSGALGGPRYIVPFLLALTPEIAAGMIVLAGRPRGRRLLLAVPLVALLFLPCLDYRNSLMERYSNGAIANVDVDWTHGQIGMHPAIFGWRMVLAGPGESLRFRPSGSHSLAIPADAIFPMTGISRIVYVLNRHGEGAGESRAIWLALGKLGLASETLWRIARMILIVLLLAALSRAALCPGMER